MVLEVEEKISFLLYFIHVLRIEEDLININI